MKINAKKSQDSERGQKRRLQILEAAEQCFCQRGFHGASMAEISNAAKMSAGHIYNYFANKEEIIAAIAEAHVSDVFPEENQSLENLIANLIADSQDRPRLSLMFDVLAEAQRNSAVSQAVQACNDLANTHLTKTVRQKFPHKNEAEIALKTKILSMALLGYRTQLLFGEVSENQAAASVLHALVAQIFKDEK